VNYYCYLLLIGCLWYSCLYPFCVWCCACSVTGRFPDSTFSRQDNSPIGLPPPRQMFNDLVWLGLAKNLKRRQITLRIIAEIRNLVCSARWLNRHLESCKDRSLCCWSYRCWVGIRRLPFEVQLCRCVRACVCSICDYWLSDQQKQ